MPVTLTRRTVLGGAVASAAAAAGCGDPEQQQGTTPGAPDKVRYMTSFQTYGRDAYVYTAVENGHLAKAGIDVDIKAGGTTGDNLKLLAAGQVDICPIDMTGLLLARGLADTGVTAVAAIQQRTLIGIIALEARGIRGPRDLPGRRVGNPPGGVVGMLWPTYARLVGIPAESVQFPTVAPPALPAVLAAGQVDAIGQFVVGIPTIEAAAGGRKAVAIPFSDYLTDLYGNLLVATFGFAKSKPDVVRRFTGALLAGLKDAVADPDAAGRHLAKHVKRADPQVAAAELRLMAPYVNAEPLGLIEERRVMQSIALLQGAGAIPQGMRPRHVVTFDLVPR